MTVEAFVNLMIERWKTGENIFASRNFEEYSEYGRRRGWLEDGDVTDSRKCLERRTAARVVHSFLRIEMGEPDEAEWRGAEQLKDLYDCHTCVNHVAQVYSKGIMSAFNDPFCFRMLAEVGETEGYEIIMRMFCRGERQIPKWEKGSCRKASALTHAEAHRLLEQEPQALLVDVRNTEHFREHHLSGAVNLPMAQLVQNVGILQTERQRTVLFYCEHGFQSQIAANCAAEAGWERAFYFSLKGT